MISSCVMLVKVLFVLQIQGIMYSRSGAGVAVPILEIRQSTT